MKKIIIFVFSLIIIISLLTSCKTDYNVYEVGGSDSQSEAKHQSEFEWSKSREINKDKENTEKTITFNGRVLSGKYRYTETTRYYNGCFDDYRYSDDNYSVTFSIDPQTGKITSYMYYQKDKSVNNGLPEKNRSECYEIAYNFLKDHVSDSENYIIEYENGRNDSEWYFVFTRKKGDFLTEDFLAITVNTYGEIIAYSLGCLGSMKNEDCPSEAAKKNIEKSVYEKLDKIFSNVEEKYGSVEHKINTKRLVKLSDGSLVLEYRIETRWQPGSDEAVSVLDVTTLVVELD